MSTEGQEILASFDLLPEKEKRAVASEILRRTFILDRKPNLDDAQLADLYSDAASEDRDLAEVGVDDYARGLAAEDVQ
jgi:hypothetical protein